jgi:nicotinate-nucleotide pyrophosphorylase (carboxylating)
MKRERSPFYSAFRIPHSAFVLAWTKFGEQTVAHDFTQLSWSRELEDDCRRIVRLAVFEDLGRGYDWTTVCLVPEEARAAANIVARRPGIMAGLQALPVILDEMDIAAELELLARDGEAVNAGEIVAKVSGPARDLLTSERTLLNVLGKLSGIATLTRQYALAIAGTKARIYDTRKTTPGWRRLEKYAVRCGGGHNHRTGLYDAILIKDNHLAFGREEAGAAAFTPAEAVRKTRAFLAQAVGAEALAAGGANPQMLVEIEVDSLEQLREVLPAAPDIVLLDNMQADLLRQAVQIRDAAGSLCELEASGGVNLQTVRAIAETGVERISAGALTHSAIALDVGLDWS